MSSSRSWARAAGLLAGVAIIAVPVGGWNRSGAQPVTGLAVSVTVNRTATLGVAPVGRVLSATLRGSADHTAPLALIDQGDRSTAIRLRMSPDFTDADALLGIEITDAGRRVYRGTLGALRTWTACAIHLHPGQTAALAVRVWLERSPSAATELPEADLTLETLEQPWAR